MKVIKTYKSFIKVRDGLLGNGIYTKLLSTLSASKQLEKFNVDSNAT